jgi:protein arginine kinase activator
MQCQICHEKTATIHLTEISNGTRTEVHFCEQCAVQQGVSAAGQISVNELLSNLLASQPSDEELAGSSPDITCPNCSMSLKKFQKHGVLGCPNDYVVFEKALLPLIEKAHCGKTRHCGKVPSRVPAETRQKIEYSSLKEELQAAIQREDYEAAARLHEKINQLEQAN